jgi:hypothetical protein
MTMNLGINLLEVDGKATPSVQGAPTSIAGFVIRSKRGITEPGRSVRAVTNFTEFVDAFGGPINSAYGAYAVRGFFDNGGTLAYVTRVLVEPLPASTTPPATGSPPAPAPTVTPAVASHQDFKNGNTTIVTIHAGSRGQKDNGTWGDALKITISAEVEKAVDIIVKLGDKVVETWSKISFTGAANASRPAVINDDLSGSKYIVLEVANQSAVNPTAIEDAPLTLGSDGSAPEVSNYTAAFDRFDTYGIQLLACPESADSAVVTAALGYCSKRGDCMFVGHTTENSDADAVITTMQAVGAPRGAGSDKSYGALYFPFIRVLDPLGGQKWVPPDGHVMGVYARTDRERGVWKAPAGVGASVNGALDVKHPINDTKHTMLVKNASVNAIRFLPGQGIIVDSSRTLCTGNLWLYVNIRLLFNFVKTSLKDGLRWTVQEPNDLNLWNKIKFNSVTPFLLGLWRRGAFGAGAPNEVFSVKVDGANNPLDSVKQGILNIEVYFYPSRPAETIIITVGQQEGGPTAGEH